MQSAQVRQTQGVCTLKGTRETSSDNGKSGLSRQEWLMAGGSREAFDCVDSSWLVRRVVCGFRPTSAGPGAGSEGGTSEEAAEVDSGTDWSAGIAKVSTRMSKCRETPDLGPDGLLHCRHRV
ncbi:unnamed protein product [Dibothriocephalus latus]|uniref:Uncharacterized protein n=1 Tax=Dibothriocephalus latus TaxID=60516 RepID=A0A3P6Q6F0_DIBLA|nr:unnamed protein product [Dibothriocephalus latus]